MAKKKYITDDQVGAIGLSKEQVSAIEEIIETIKTADQAEAEKAVEELKKTHEAELAEVKSDCEATLKANESELEQLRKLAKTEIRIATGTYTEKRDEKRTFRFKKGIIKFKFKGEDHDANDAIKNETLMVELIDRGSQLIEEVV